MMKSPFLVASPSRAPIRGELDGAPASHIRKTGFTFTRCIYLTKAEIARAAQSSAECGAIVEHLATIARPHDGAPLLLLLFARLATVACDWLDGDLFIVLEAHQPWSTRVTVATALGSGMREKVFPSVEL